MNKLILQHMFNDDYEYHRRQRIKDAMDLTQINGVLPEEPTNPYRDLDLSSVRFTVDPALIDSNNVITISLDKPPKLSSARIEVFAIEDTDE